MSGVTLTVHRSAKEIGGNCIEIASASEERLILDVGRSLDAPEDAMDLLPETLDRQRPATVLISHPHQDHYGLLEETPKGWPVFAGAATEKLIRLTAAIRGEDRRLALQSLATRPAKPDRRIHDHPVRYRSQRLRRAYVVDRGLWQTVLILRRFPSPRTQGSAGLSA